MNRFLTFRNPGFKSKPSDPDPGQGVRDPSRRKFLRRTSGLMALGLAASYPFLMERYMVRVNHYRLAVKDLPAGFNGFRIVHLSDLHYGPLVPLSWLRNVFDLARKQNPDLIALTGDYVWGQEAVDYLEVIWTEMEKLSAPFGVRMVLGNHDHWAGGNVALELLESSGRSLRNRAETLTRGKDRLIVGGVGDLLEDKVLIDKALAGRDEKVPRIVLAHNPDTADLDYSSRVDLFLCGHTHGGQVNIPFVGTPVLPVRNKNYNYGIRKTPRSVAFINKGIGWAMLPVRFNCAPEIAVLHLVPKERDK